MNMPLQTRYMICCSATALKCRMAILACLLSCPAFAQVSVPNRVRIQEDKARAMVAKKVDPTYPPSARSNKIQGEVVLVVEISKRGTVQGVVVVSGIPVLARPAIRAVKQWRFKPYILEGEPVAMETTLHIRFNASSR